MAWRNPIEGVSLWEVVRMIPRSALRTWAIAWWADRRRLVGLLAAQVIQGVAAAVMLPATQAAVGSLLGGGNTAHRLHQAAGAQAALAAAAGVDPCNAAGLRGIVDGGRPYTECGRPEAA
ncbi:hypothetical protein [Actinomadura nitritigenes]|uniref:hypothetical protein n=1 Tax=Actinomadura nitritigenes TaxID=134602 RepID=UPI0031D636DE